MGSKTLDISSLEEALSRAGAYMSIAARAEDAIIFVGTTKSGKSTLVNYLIGNKLTGRKIGHKICIEKADNSHGPQIGVAATSETAMPSRYVSEKLPGLALWDVPGFEDNRGPNTDICNAFYICELFKNIKSAKIILVVDVVTFRDDSLHAVRTLLRAIENLLTDKFEDSFPGIGMIVTKVDMSNGFEALKEDVTDSLQTLLTDDIDISKCGKELVKHLISNNQKIGFFKKATEGPIADEIAVGITEAISGSEAIPDDILKVISPSISESAKVSLFEAREQLSSVQKFVELQGVVLTAFEGKMWNKETIKDWDLSTDEFMDLQIDLCMIKQIMSSVVDDSISFESTINILKITDDEIEGFINRHRLCEKAKYMEFVDKLLNLRESNNFNVCIKHIIALSKQTLEEIISQVRSRIGEINAGKVYEEVARVQEDYEKKIDKYENKVQALADEIERYKNSSNQCTFL